MSPKDFFPRRLDKVSISRIKKTMSDVSYLSDDLVFLPMSAEINPTAIAPRSIDGFAAIIMLSGEAVVQINTKSYTIKPNTILFFSPESVICTERASSSAAGYFLAYSKTFINRVQVGLSTSLPVFMHYRKSPILKINEAHTLIKLKLVVDTRYSSVMDYFEIFLQRMVLCRKAAERLRLQFRLMINEQQLI